MVNSAHPFRVEETEGRQEEPAWNITYHCGLRPQDFRRYWWRLTLDGRHY